MNTACVRRAVLAAAALSMTVLGTAVPSTVMDKAETLPLREAVHALPVAAEDRTGYDRKTSFGGWVDADRDGCSTRSEVLLEEAAVPPTRSGRCTLTGGRWLSWYDHTYVHGPRGLDIDHVVPLAESWDSGASKWTFDKRSRYANYLDDPRHLVAVTARSNRQKADRDPSESVD